MGCTVFSRACGYVSVFITCIVCSRDVGSSTATTPVTGVVGAGGVVCRERLDGDLGFTACLGVDRAPRSAIATPVGLRPPAVGSVMSTSTQWGKELIH